MEICGVGGVTQLHLSFNPRMNIVCGPNGIGKTTVLECVAHCFTQGYTNILKRNVAAPKGIIASKLFHNSQEIQVNIEFNQYEPNDNAIINIPNSYSAYLFSLKTTRTFSYVPLSSISKDTDKPFHVLVEESKNGVVVHDVKNWFVNRFLYSAHEGVLSSAQLDNFILAKSCFSALNSSYQFSRVNASSNEILVSSPSGEVYYEYLSSGFKSCLSILFGIIKEIEFRFVGMAAKDFEGVVLIDEIELHLHPEWQYRIANVLMEIFPCAQFIVTTHSPHVIQSADRDQIIALEYSNGRVTRRDLPSSVYGFKGWTIDEVLTDVMGMLDTRTEIFKELICEFNSAIDAEDQNAARIAYAKIDSSLHPQSHSRKLFRLQLASISME